MKFRRTATALREELEVSATAADDLRVIVPAVPGRAVQVMAFQHPFLVHRLERDIARATLTGSMSLATDTLGGRVDIATAPHLSANFGSNPDSGGVRITGASNARMSLLANAGGTSTFRAELDRNGDGVTDSVEELDWLKLVSKRTTYFPGIDGLSFWTPRSNGGTPATLARDDNSLRLLDKPHLFPVSVYAPLLLQFDKPLSPDTFVQFRLLDNGNGLVTDVQSGQDALSESRLEVPMDVEFHGAAILIRPREALHYGHSYSILASNTGDFEHSRNVMLRSNVGTSDIYMPEIQTSFNTDSVMWAGVRGAGRRSVVMSEIETPIRAIVPLATSFPLRYQWTQVSGPALVLSSPTMADTTVRLAVGSAPGIGRAVLQLVVTDAIGRKSITPVEMQTANFSGTRNVLYFVTTPSDSFSGGETRAYTNQSGNFRTQTFPDYFSVEYSDSDARSYRTLVLTDANGGIPAVGSYIGAQEFHYTKGIPQLSFRGSTRSCSDATSSFKVHEISRDSDGIVQRLAVDFEQTCIANNEPMSIRGAFRINSDWPISP